MPSPLTRRAARLSWALALLTLLAPALPAVGASLPPPVAAALDRARLPRDALVALVQEVGSNRPRLVWQTERPVNPASLMKLLTTDAGFDLLGPAYTWSTPVWLQGPVEGGVLEGDLVIKGSGDPTLVLERLWLMLRRVRQAGVREIHGDIVLDRSAFTVPAEDPAAFDGEALRPYNVRADALMLNFKALTYTITPDPARGVATVAIDPPMEGVQVDPRVPLTAAPCGDWRSALRADFSDPLHIRFSGGFAAACGEKTWPTAYADPDHYNERALLGMWAEVGGRITGRVRDGVAPAHLAPTFSVTSPPLAEVIRDINKYSNNVMAQQLFLTLGLTQRGAGTPAAARDTLRRWARDRLGDAGAALTVENGSGLSRDGRVSARLLGQLLLVAWSGPVMPELMASLPVSGVDGTLKRSHVPFGRAHLKTGSLRDVAGVAGYVLADSGRRYVVVAIVNDDQASRAWPALEAMVQWAADDSAVDLTTTTTTTNRH